jgi:uncharacterized membrane protein YcaP (DUF421 family)
LLGKRELGQMSLYDFVMIVILGNAVQNAMLATDVTLGGGLVAAVVLLLMNRGFNYGYEKVEDVHMAVLEVDGTISIVPEGAAVHRTKRHVKQLRLL